MKFICSTTTRPSCSSPTQPHALVVEHGFGIAAAGPEGDVGVEVHHEADRGSGRLVIGDARPTSDLDGHHHRCGPLGALDHEHDRAAVGRGRLLAHDERHGLGQSPERMIDHGTFGMTGAVERTTHVLLVHPRIEDANRQELAERRLADRRRSDLVETLGGQRAQLGQALGAQLAELGEHLRARAVAVVLDPVLVHLADGVAQVIGARRLVGGGGFAAHHPLGADDVAEVVLHAPARQLARCLPLLLVEPGAELDDRCPLHLEQVDHRLVGHLCHATPRQTGHAVPLGTRAGTLPP